MNHRLPRAQLLRLGANDLLNPNKHCHRQVHHATPQQSAASHAQSLHRAIISRGVPYTRTDVTPNSSPLSILPTSAILRSYLITGLSSSPRLLGASVLVLQQIAASNSAFFSPERNPLIRWALKRTFYDQFCAGENRQEVQKTVEQRRSMGFTGVILEYALELLESGSTSPERTAREIDAWRKGMLETVEMASQDDFVALKWTGLGAEALQLLNMNKPPTPAMLAAIYEVCDRAASKGVAVLPGAELSHTNPGLDRWSLDLQRRYNSTSGRPIIYTTYQAYLRSAPRRLAIDLESASKEGFTLGVKLVRGAYLASEPKHEVCSSKEETDRQYDALMEAVLHRRYNDVLRPATDGAGFPNVALMIACHNKSSVEKAMAIRNQQAPSERISCAFSQLQGMADEISCELVQASKAADVEKGTVDRPRVYKCATWGTMTECLHFLLRRAAENQDAVGRTADTHKAMGRELWRRWRTAFRLN